MMLSYHDFVALGTGRLNLIEKIIRARTGSSHHMTTMDLFVKFKALTMFDLGEMGRIDRQVIINAVKEL